MDFYLASDSSPAIHSKTIAKVRKRIGICKKIGKFLANLNKIVDVLLLNQASNACLSLQIIHHILQCIEVLDIAPLYIKNGFV